MEWINADRTLMVAGSPINVSFLELDAEKDLVHLYGNLEGKKTGTATGPVTFGEIAYQLANQTPVYVEIG